MQQLKLEESMPISSSGARPVPEPTRIEGGVGKRKRGRPRRPMRPSPPTDFRLNTPYDPALVCGLPAEPLVASFRRGTVLPAEQDLGRWYQAIADAIESGDAVRTGYCALYAMCEINSLVDCYLRPLARIGKKKLESDKRRGRRTALR
jgi:hypothetical protein